MRVDDIGVPKKGCRIAHVTGASIPSPREVLLATAIVPQAVYFAMRVKEVSRAFRGRTFTPVNGNESGERMKLSLNPGDKNML